MYGMRMAQVARDWRAVVDGSIYSDLPLGAGTNPGGAGKKRQLGGAGGAAGGAKKARVAESPAPPPPPQQQQGHWKPPAAAAGKGGGGKQGSKSKVDPIVLEHKRIQVLGLGLRV